MYNGEDKDDLVKEIRKKWKESRDGLASWRKEAREDYAFRSGEQWSPEDVAKLQEENRPCVTFNRVGAIIDSVTGIEINSRQEIKFIPRSTEDRGLNELLTQAAKWVRDNCYAEEEESEAFQDAVICGVGFTETRMDYDENPDGQIVEERKDPLHMTWLPSARKRCLEDSNYFFNAEWMDKEEAKTRWPNAEFLWSDEFFSDDKAAHNADRAYLYENQSANQEKRENQVLVLHYQCVKLEPFIRALDPFTKEVKSFSEDDFEKLQENVKVLGMVFVDGQTKSTNEIPYVKQNKKVYYRGFLIGEELLEYGKAPSQTGFTFKAITGKRDRNKNSWYGIVRPLKDPQRFGNKFFSQILHIVNSNAKGGAFVEENALKDPKKAEEQWASNSGPLIQLNEGGIEKIRERNAVTYPQGLDRLMNFAFDSMPWVSGMNPEMLGMADKAQAGVLEAQRKQSAVTILAPMFDALRRYRKSQGRLLLDYIQNYISDGRLMKITGPMGEAQYIPLVKQPDTVEYDVIVDQSPTSPDSREKTWSAMQAILPVMLKTGHPIPPSFFDASPLPVKVAEEFKAMTQKQIPPEIQAQMQAMQQQMQGLTQELQKTKEENLMLKTGAAVDMAKTEMNYETKLMQMAQKGEQNQKQDENEKMRLALDAREASINERIANLNAEMEQFRAGVEVFKAKQEQTSMVLDQNMKVMEMVKSLAEKKPEESNSSKEPSNINITLETKPGKRKAKKVNGEWILEDA